MPKLSSQLPDIPGFLRTLILIAILAATPFLSAGASAADTTWSDRVERYALFTNFLSLVEGGTVTPHWLAGGHRFWYATPSGEGTSFFVVETKTGSKKHYFDEKRLRARLADVSGKDLPPGGLPFDTFTLVDDESHAQFTVGKQTFRLDLETYELIDTTVVDDVDPRAQEVTSPDGRWIVSVEENNLWVRDAGSKEKTRLTDDGEQFYPWTLDEVLWAGDGTRFALPRYDSRALHRAPVVKWLPDKEEVEWVPYAFAREPDARTGISVVDLSRNTVQPIGGGTTEGYQLLVAWRDDDREVLFMRFGPGMKTLNLMAANPSTGKTRTIVRDEQGTFIEGLHISLTYDSFHYALPDGERFIWRSERDGWVHFYLYRYDGTLVRRLTEGEFEVDRVSGFDEASGLVYFTAQADPRNPYDRHLYRVSLEGKGMKQLTVSEGTHRVTLCPDFSCFVDNHSSPSRPPSAELRQTDGVLVASIEKADASRLDAMDWKPPEEYVVKAADGETDLYGLLFKPHDFDPEKKYPVIEVIYAGSWAPVVPRAFGAGENAGLAHALAQLNFVTFVVDGRGTPGRGKAFQDVIYGQIGRHEIPDHVATLRQLAADRPYMDMDRVGVHGKSWGGYFALRAMLQAPDVYHVGIASGIVADLSTSSASSIAPYMGLAGENEVGYAYANCLTMAENLQGRLLISIATADINTPFAQTMRMVEAFIKAGKRIDMMLFPDQHHWLKGESMQYFYGMLRDYFVEHLEPEGSGS